MTDSSLTTHRKRGHDELIKLSVLNVRQKKKKKTMHLVIVGFNAC